MLSVPCLESTAVVHAGRTEMEVPCSCGIDGQIHRYNNPDVLIAISCASYHDEKPHDNMVTENFIFKML